MLVFHHLRTAHSSPPPPNHLQSSNRASRSSSSTPTPRREALLLQLDPRNRNNALTSTVYRAHHEHRTLFPPARQGCLPPAHCRPSFGHGTPGAHCRPEQEGRARQQPDGMNAPRLAMELVCKHGRLRANPRNRSFSSRPCPSSSPSSSSTRPPWLSSSSHPSSTSSPSTSSPRRSAFTRPVFSSASYRCAVRHKGDCVQIANM